MIYINKYENDRIGDGFHEFCDVWQVKLEGAECKIIDNERTSSSGKSAREDVQGNLEIYSVQLKADWPLKLWKQYTLQSLDSHLCSFEVLSK